MFDHRGRIGRVEFLEAQIIALFIIFPSVGIATYLFSVGGANGAWVGLLIVIVGGFVSVVLTFKSFAQRFHDFDKTGDWTLLILIPFLYFPVLLYCLLKPGDDGVNHYDKSLAEVLHDSALSSSTENINAGYGSEQSSAASGGSAICAGSGSEQFSAVSGGSAVCSECGAKVPILSGRLLNHRVGSAWK